MWTVLSTCWCALWEIMSESCCCFVSLKQNSYMRRKTHLYETRLTAWQHWQQSWDWVEKWSRSSLAATPAPLLAFCTKPKCQNLHRDLDILNSRLSSLGFSVKYCERAYCLLLWNFLEEHYPKANVKNLTSYCVFAEISLKWSSAYLCLRQNINDCIKHLLKF